MVLYNTNNILTKYESPIDIIKEFYTVRLIYYSKRKESLLKKYTHKRDILENKIRFLHEQINNILIIYKKKKDVIINELESTGYMKLSKTTDSIPNYEYLLSMRMDSVTEEKLAELQKEFDEINDKIIDLESKTNKDLWKIDLEDFKLSYNDYCSKLDKIEDLSKLKISTTLKTKVNKKQSAPKGTGRGRANTGRGRGRGKGVKK